MQTDVCVIGNGVIGKTAALGLSQAGYKVCLLSPLRDIAPLSTVEVPAWDTRVYAVNAVARKLLESVKIWDALDASRIAAIDGMVINGDGSHAGQIMFDAYGAHRSSLAWIIEDNHLNRTLDAALQFAPNVQRMHGVGVQMRVDAQGARIDMSNADSITAALIVGADGANSWVRAQAEIDVDYRPYDQRAIVANFACSTPHQGIAHQWFDAQQGVIALLPLPGDRLSLVWSAPEALADTLLNESAAALAQRLSDLPGQPFGTLTPLQPETVRAIPLALLRAHRSVAQRIVLVGDAAHAIHPLAGQGMNLGFGDIVALLNTAASPEFRRDCGDARALSSYARARKEKVLLMQLGTDGLQRLFSSSFEPLRLARNIGLDLLNKFPLIKRQLMSHAAGNES